MDLSFRIAGEAGQGIQTIGELLVKTFSKMGLFVFSHQDYMSRIRGGNNFYQIRISERPIHSSQRSIDLLLALNMESIPLHRAHVKPKGMVLWDSSRSEEGQGEGSLGIPILRMARELGGEILGNIVATGALLGMLGFELEPFLEVVKGSFSEKGKEIAEKNERAAYAGYEYARRECLTCSFEVCSPKGEEKRLLGGNEAIGMGAVLSGVRFYSAYPMTPSTGILNYLASKAEEFGIIVEQAEDEIAAINMVIGASYGGVRAMTGSSGGGFALMVEGLSLSAATETPIVIAEVQRPGPATGLPTRTEQADLLFVLFAAHGEFPRVLFAPGSPEQALYLTNKAFHMSERYQVPAFILSDQYLADSLWTWPGIDEGKILYRDYRIREADGTYKRHRFTQDGVSPLAIPGIVEGLVVTDSDEHDEEGHITESAEIRKRMVEKRLMKLLHMREEMEGPTYLGHRSPKIVLVGWGSTLGVLMDTVETVNKKIPCGMLHFSEIWPFPVSKAQKAFEVLKGAIGIGVENNATGQFAWLLRAEAQIELPWKISKYDGRPFYSDELSEEVLAYARSI